jgi:hypothetical protein
MVGGTGRGLQRAADGAEEGPPPCWQSCSTAAGRTASWRGVAGGCDPLARWEGVLPQGSLMLTVMLLSSVRPRRVERRAGVLLTSPAM